MTSMLKKAFEEAAKLSEIEQNALARWVLEELKSDRKWDKQFAESEDILAELALEALKEESDNATPGLDEDKL